MRAGFLILVLLSGCATTRGFGLQVSDAPTVFTGDHPGAVGLSGSVPMVGTPPANWDEAFRKLVAGCPDEGRGPVIDFNTAFELTFTAVSVAVGVSLLARFQTWDAGTVGIAIVGGVAAIGALTGIIWGMISRARGHSDTEVIKQAWRAAWASGTPEAKRAMIDDVAQRCNDSELAASYLQLLGPPQ